MKTINLMPFKAYLIIVISTTSSIVHSTANVYLENNYGATLNYKTSSLFKTKGERIGNNVRILLGDVDRIPELSLRATGKGSQWVSYYHDLGYLLNEIKSLQNVHTDKDAVISVGPSRIGWNITYTWEPKTNDIALLESGISPQKPALPTVNVTSKNETNVSIEFIGEQIEKEKKFMALQTTEERLDAIKNGVLGINHAKKARAICSADYSPAERLGKINLCTELKRILFPPSYRKATPKAGSSHPNLNLTVEEIKQSIDRLHGALTRYISRGEAI